MLDQTEGRRRACLHCRKRFRTGAYRNLFCSSRCKTGYGRQVDYCFYCGESALSKDHLLGRAVRSNISPAKKHKKGHETIPCCTECNSFLSRVWGYDIDIRLMCIIEAITKKYKLNRGVVEWDEDEIDDLGYSLEQYVLGKLAERERAEARLQWAKDRLLDFMVPVSRQSKLWAWKHMREGEDA